MILKDLEYLKNFKISIRKKLDGSIEVPISEDLFIIRTKNQSVLYEDENIIVTPYYLWIVLNSNLFQILLSHKMGGSTGMQVLRKT